MGHQPSRLGSPMPTSTSQGSYLEHAVRPTLTPLDRTIPNAVVRSKGDKRTYFGHEIEHCVDYSSLHYRLPFEKVRPESGLTIYEIEINIFSANAHRDTSLTGMRKRPYGMA